MTKSRETRERESIRRIEAAKAGQGEGAEPKDRTLTLSTGVVLRIKQVAPILLSDIVVEATKDKPKVPVTYIKDLDREDENPNDPDYVNATKEWMASVMLDINNAFILLGTEVVAKPRNFPSEDDEDWLDRMRIMRRPTATKAERYLSWIKYAAAPTADDTTAIVREAGRLAGVAESDVQSAINGFPS